MRILLLGHKGMLGADLLLELKDRHEVAGLDKDDIDITSAAACTEAIHGYLPDAIINAAAYTDVDGCETNQEECMVVNADAVKNIVEACCQKNILIVHFSTDYVFDGTSNEPYRENHPCNPINAYGFSKLAGERYLFSLTENYLLIRTAWLFGKNGKNFARTIINKAQTSSKLEVVDDQFGSPTYTKDLAAALQFLLEQNIKGVFHITNRGICSWYQFARRILQETSINDVHVVPIKTKHLNRPAKRPLYSVLSNRKFIETTGKTMRPWQLALQDYLKSNTII